MCWKAFDEDAGWMHEVPVAGASLSRRLTFSLTRGLPKESAGSLSTEGAAHDMLEQRMIIQGRAMSIMVIHAP